MKILFITNNLPYPPIQGGRLRNYSLLRRIGKKHQLYILVTSTDEKEKEYIPQLEEFCEKVGIVLMPDYGALSKPIDWFRYLLAGKPPDLRLNYFPEMADTIRKWVTEEDFDIVNIDHSYMAIYLDDVKKYSKAKTVLTFHDVLSVKYQRTYPMETKISRKVRLWLHSKMLKIWEPAVAGRFEHVITMSEDEKQLLKDMNNGLRIDVAPNGVDTHMYPLLPEEDQSSRILFVGNMGYMPNIDAMEYFAKEIFPLIQKQIDHAELWIVGISPSQTVLDLQSDKIFVTGRVEDLLPYYRQSKVCIVPLRAGSGTRLKIVEAMAMGRPVISTSIGCEGIDVIDGENIAIADTAQEFAQRTVQLMNNQQERKRLVENARMLVEEHYDWDQITDHMMKIYEDCKEQ